MLVRPRRCVRHDNGVFSAKYTDLESWLLNYGHRYLQTPTGRWLSRDPLEEQGGLNLYAICSGDLVNCYDALGLWEILRNPEEARANAIPDFGDTIRALARILRLSPEEWQKWAEVDLLAERGRTDLDSPLGPCDLVKIPNTVAAYSHDVTDDNVTSIFEARIKQQMQKYRNKKYRVLEEYRKDSTDVFLSLWRAEGLYGFFVTSHGGEMGQLSVSSRWAPFAIGLWNNGVGYHLGTFWAMFCYSKTNTHEFNWRDIPSSTGGFRGYGLAGTWTWRLVEENVNNPDLIPEK